MDSVPAGTTQGNKPATAFSCVRCFERKVKCDKLQPCSACTKQGADCIYRVPPPPRRRKRRVQEDMLTERLRRYEQVLQQQGIDPSEIARQHTPAARDGRKQSTDSHGTTETPDRQYASSQLFYNSGRSHYVENNLWNRVKEEMDTTNEAFDMSSDSEDDAETPQDDSADFVLPWTPASTIARPYHPHPDHVAFLWQVFLDNVNPLSKVIHRPTLEVMIQKAMQNLDKVPRGLETLMFAIYGAAVLSLTDDECQQQLGERKKVLLSRYRAATKVTLVRAKFLGTSDLIVLQALAIHLLTTRNEYDPRTLWVLTGIAVRIGESMGLHRDGSLLGLPFFESEIRRRVFWQLSMLDYRSAELSGSSKFRSFLFHEDLAVQIPLNVDDDEIYPGMTHPPLPAAKASETVFCSLRYEFAKFWNKKQAERARKGTPEEHLWANYETVGNIAEKDKAIDELQQIVQTSYVRYCDPMNPVHLMTSLVATVAIASMRLVAHHPRRYSREEDIPEVEKELLWATCLKLLEGDSMAYSDRKLRRFIWHTSFYFQHQAIIHVLDCLRAQPLMLEANRAWQLIEECYEHHSEFIKDTKKPLHIAIGTLCLKAYHAREQAQAQVGTLLSNPPTYIVRLRQQREAAHAKQADAMAAKMRSQTLNSSEVTTVEGTPSPKQKPLPEQQHNYLDATNSNSMNMSPFAPMYPSQPPKQEYSMDTGADIGGNQATQNIWFDSFGYPSNPIQNVDVDLMLSQDGNSMDTNANMIDWTQWDNLIKAYGQGI